MPPLAGFFGKFLVFASALHASQSGTPILLSLAVLGCLNAAVGAYYYLRIVVVMYLRPPVGDPVSMRASLPAMVAVAACAVLSLVVGLFPGPLFRMSHEAGVAAVAQPDPLAFQAVRTAER